MKRLQAKLAQICLLTVMAAATFPAYHVLLRFILPSATIIIPYSVLTAALAVGFFRPTWFYDQEPTADLPSPATPYPAGGDIGT